MELTRTVGNTLANQLLQILRSPDLETHEVHDTLHLGVEIIYAATFGVFLKLREAIKNFLHFRGILLDSLLLKFVLKEAVCPRHWDGLRSAGSHSQSGC